VSDTTITSYSTLKTVLKQWLYNRTDLNLSQFIANAENKFRRDRRVRSLQYRSDFQASADGVSLPADYKSLVGLYHNGSSYYGELDNTTPGMLSELKGRYGSSGIPKWFSIVDSKIYFAPVPDTTYTLAMAYWRGIEALSDSNPTNWLLEYDPDIYLYGALVESAPYLEDDPRIAVWKEELNERLDQLDKYTQAAEFSGSLKRQFTPIG